MEKKTEAGPGAGQRREPADPGPQNEGSREKTQGSEVKSRPGPLCRPGSTLQAPLTLGQAAGAALIVAMESSK